MVKNRNFPGLYKTTVGLFVLMILPIIYGCVSNNPYPPSERGKNIYYSTFGEEPKHLDPAIAYSSDEYSFMGQIYEPPLGYHYLKRPFQLIPVTAQDVPKPRYFDSQGNKLPSNADESLVAKAVYEVSIKPGIMYQEHPCFARDKNGDYIYRNLTEDALEDIYEIRHFNVTGTKELTAHDYVYQIKRLSDPTLHCPILSTLSNYIMGMRDYAVALAGDLEAERERRREAVGASYNQEEDEKKNPIVIDLGAHEFPGVQVVDKYTYRLILDKKYPQIIYWLAMPFFCPIPKEAVDFYSQGPLKDKNITLDRFPVGTGPYMMHTYDPHKEIILARNKNFRKSYYPSEGQPKDYENGMLDDAGKQIPFVDQAVYKLEKEYIPRWNKFLQGYYDASGISSDTFDRAIQFSDQGTPEASSLLKERSIRLVTSISPITYYLGFNMLDDVVGGYTEEKRKLRQAISIALDYEEYIQIFTNGRAISSHSPIPPGIYGYEEGEKGINTYVYNWDDDKGPVRKSVDEAKRLLAEAGYPGGKGKDGKPLVIGFDNAWTGSGATPLLSWMRKKLASIGITMENRTTDYNRFREKVMNGNFQLLSWGWIADYPDPENFLFLLYGPNGKAEHDGENVANYSNPEYDELFEKMRSMENSPERLEIIRQMKHILQRDAPWVFTTHPVSFSLYHDWIRNIKPREIGLGGLKYTRIDVEKRQELRNDWNEPIVWPLLVFFGILVVGTLPAVVTAWRRERGRKG
ncbi:peptide ABC transporter substrate-binding protein [Candidatus Poribacteria bacterium]|nr:peptide ABC transporter substrate-binding protein [Candidatus Poribacteria bacterium]